MIQYNASPQLNNRWQKSTADKAQKQTNETSINKVKEFSKLVQEIQKLDEIFTNMLKLAKELIQKLNSVKTEQEKFVIIYETFKNGSTK